MVRLRFRIKRKITNMSKVLRLLKRIFAFLTNQAFAINLT